MKVQVLYDITDCRDCPFAKQHVGHGECWTECSHKGNGRLNPYGNILWGCQEDFKAIPPWCPLGLSLEAPEFITKTGKRHDHHIPNEASLSISPSKLRMDFHDLLGVMEENLADGYSIEITAEKGECSINLTDPEDNDVEFCRDDLSDAGVIMEAIRVSNERSGTQTEIACPGLELTHPRNRSNG